MSLKQFTEKINKKKSRFSEVWNSIEMKKTMITFPKYGCRQKCRISVSALAKKPYSKSGSDFIIFGKIGKIQSGSTALVETKIMGVARSVGFPLMHWRISASRSSEKVRKKH